MDIRDIILLSLNEAQVNNASVYQMVEEADTGPTFVVALVVRVRETLNAERARRVARFVGTKEVTASAECAICLEHSGPACRLECGHSFHAECLAKWLVRSPTCPLCRARVPCL